MIELTRMRRCSRWLAPLALVLLLTGLLPQLPARAASVIDQPLDNSQSEFVRGSFLGTAVSPEVNASVPNDQPGTVQLTPLGLLNPWPRRGDLPQGLASHGVATIGDRLFTVAGVVRTGATNAVYWTRIDRTNGAPTDHNLPAGDPRIVSPNWANDPLPAAQGSVYTDCTSPTGLTSRVNSAVAAYDKGDGSGFLYVIGGSAGLVNCGAPPPPPAAELLSVPTVQIGRVAANGAITWSGGTSSTFFPTPPLVDDPGTGIETTSVGIQSAQAVVATAGSGKVYLYLIGGAGVYPINANVDLVRLTFATPAVFYTEINPTDGSLRNPQNGSSNDPWVRTANVPVRPPTGQTGTYGIFEHTASVGRSVFGAGLRDAIFVAGGYIVRQNPVPALPRTTLNPFVYQAAIDGNTGALTWDDTPTRQNVPVATEGGSVASLASLAYNNKLYLVAGTPNDSTANGFNSVIAGGFDSSFAFQPILSDTEFFVGRQQTTPVLGSGLVETGAGYLTAVTPPGATDANGAWAFAVGGQTTSDQLSDAIYVGKVGSISEASTSVRARDGWYYSQFYDISIARPGENNSAARVLSIRWATEINRGAGGNPNADVIIEFRRVLQPDLRCDASVFPDSVPWLRLDGDTGSNFFSTPTSTRPQNEVSLRDAFGTESFNATCFQYRARFTQNGLDGSGVPNVPVTPSASPKLLSISVQKSLPGDVDLFVDSFEIGPDASGRISTFSLTIKNLNGTAANTIAIAQERFPAVICVQYNTLEEVQAPQPLNVPDLPILNDADTRVNCAPIYRWVDSSETLPDQAFSLAGGNAWQVNFDNIPHIPGKVTGDPLSDPKEAFAVPGHYTVAVLLDPFGLVSEGGAGKANNRGENLNNGQPLTRSFTITQQGFDRRVRLPLVRR